MTRAPAHAGRLRRPERLAFALVVVLMAAFVVSLAVAATRAGAHALTGYRVPAGSREIRAGTTGSPADSATVGAEQTARPDGSGPVGSADSRAAALDAALASALRPLVLTHAGQFSVGVIDETTGSEALFRPGRSCPAASVLAGDILAALLYQHQVAATQLTVGEDDLAGRMIQTGSAAAASRLWTSIGGGPGLAAANRALRLTHTSPVKGRRWWLSRTTVSDQLQLLTDLTAARSVLGPSLRDYALGLMGDVIAADRWGVSAAADGGTGPAVIDGWLPRPRVADSIGVVQRDGQVLLIAVLSTGGKSRAAAIALVRSAALAAAAAITRPGL